MIKTISIYGFRGFEKRQTIEFAIPSGENNGSGLSIIIGANNSGKTTIIEAIKAFNHYNSDEVCFSEGRRNNASDGRVELSLTTADCDEYIIRTIETGGAATTSNITVADFNSNKTLSYIVPSRRTVPVFFFKNVMDRKAYISNSLHLEQLRSAELQDFNARIFEINKNKEKFDPVINRILGNEFEWLMDCSDTGQYYIKYYNNGNPHNGDGIGDGIWSVFTICAALFDSEPNSTIVIDEPELSLHPSLQRRLMKLFLEYSKDRQIILSTHSPYFIDWETIVSGGALIKVSKEYGASCCYSIKDTNRKFINGLIKDLHNIHTIGITAKEALFTEDKLILTEGQEDVTIYSHILKELGMELDGEFFGWGAGGESKIEGFLQLFHQLGYKKIVAIYDGDKEKEALLAQRKYPLYKICSIPTKDIRDKDERKIESKIGIATRAGTLKEEYKGDTEKMFIDINSYFKSSLEQDVVRDV